MIVTQRVAEQIRDAPLSFSLDLADRAHTRRIPLVRSSCIMPPLSARVLASFASRTAISASISERMEAMAICSAIDGTGSNTLAMLVLLMPVTLVPTEKKRNWAFTEAVWKQ